MENFFSLSQNFRSLFNNRISKKHRALYIRKEIFFGFFLHWPLIVCYVINNSRKGMNERKSEWRFLYIIVIFITITIVFFRC
jgi:hypothetical protein